MPSLSSLLNPINECPSIIEGRTPSNAAVDLTPDIEALHEHLSRTAGPIFGSSSMKASLRLVLDQLPFERGPSSSCANSAMSTTSTSVPSSPASSPFPAQHTVPHPPAPVTIDPMPTLRTNVQINRITTLSKLFTYSPEAFVEYPETQEHGLVGHIFTFHAQTWKHPKNDICYSLGSPKGGTPEGSHVSCWLLKDEEGNMVPCQQTHWTCMLFR
jgi:hypothetical protein